MQTMAFPHSLPPIAITSLLLLFLISLPPTTLSQDPTIAECSPRLLPLAPCAPYVQGSVQTPAQPCCTNLNQLNDQQPDCLCLLLNNTVISSFPINRTLALQLPALCDIQVDFSTCSGMPVPPGSPDSQVPLGSNTNSTVAASPTVAVTPRPRFKGFGFPQSAGVKLKMKGELAVVAAAVTAFLLTKVPY